MSFYLLKRKSRLDPTMTGERYFSKVAVHPLEPPSFFTTADLKLSRLPPRSPLPFAALPSMSLPPAASLADDTDKRKQGHDRTEYGFNHSAYPFATSANSA